MHFKRLTNVNEYDYSTYSRRILRVEICILKYKLQYVASVGSGYQHQKGVKVLLTT